MIWGCLGKFKHANKRNAERAIRRKIKGLHAYRCSLCKAWHVGRDSNK